MEEQQVRSISYDQDEILSWITKLHCNGTIECDLTYGKGGFWRNLPEPTYKFDIDPQYDNVVRCDSSNTPLEPKSVNSVIFDPPFLTYIKNGRQHGSGNMIMAKQFSGYWSIDQLNKHYLDTILEANRILNNKGILIVKCQDIIHNHKLNCTHADVINWAKSSGFRLKDMFILLAKHRLPSPNRGGKQQHARVWHCYFLVFEKV